MSAHSGLIHIGLKEPTTCGDFDVIQPSSPVALYHSEDGASSPISITEALKPMEISLFLCRQDLRSARVVLWIEVTITRP